MCHAVRTLSLFALLALPLAAAPVPKPPPANPIEGTWHDGTEGESGYWHFGKDGVAGVGEKKNPQDCKYRIGPSKDPKQIEWSHNGGKTWFLGIYEVDGDSLKLAFGRGGVNERPESMDGKNLQFNYYKLKRVEK